MATRENVVSGVVNCLRNEFFAIGNHSLCGFVEFYMNITSFE